MFLTAWAAFEEWLEGPAAEACDAQRKERRNRNWRQNGWLGAVVTLQKQKRTD